MTMTGKEEEKEGVTRSQETEEEEMKKISLTPSEEE